MTKKALVLGLIAIAGIPAAAQADLIYGTLNATGTATVSLGKIGFLDNELFINAPAGAQVGGFTALAGTTGTIQDLNNPPDATGPLNVPLFITFNAAPNISFTLTFLLPGVDGAAGCSANPPAAGQTCTPNLPDLSPYNLFNTSATSSTASFNIIGQEVNSVTGEHVGITGAFSEPFTALNYQQIIGTVTGGGTITTAFGAQFQTVPEPDTLIELMIGLGALGIGSFRKRKSAGV